MGVYDLALTRRTIRKFMQKRIDRELLVKFVNAAKYSPSFANLQPVRYVIVNEDATVQQLFKYVRWAGYISPQGNPAENERPVAFIALLSDTQVSKQNYEQDIGAAAQTIFLTALEEGIGTCWMGAIDRDGIRELLNIPERYIIDTVIALGYPAESPIAEDEKGSIKYYKDEAQVLHVPKRRLEDVILEFNVTDNK